MIDSVCKKDLESSHERMQGDMKADLILLRGLKIAPLKAPFKVLKKKKNCLVHCLSSSMLLNKKTTTDWMTQMSEYHFSQFCIWEV